MIDGELNSTLLSLHIKRKQLLRRFYSEMITRRRPRVHSENGKTEKLSRHVITRFRRDNDHWRPKVTMWRFIITFFLNLNVQRVKCDKWSQMYRRTLQLHFDPGGASTPLCGLCRYVRPAPKNMVLTAVLVISRVSILTDFAIFVINWVWSKRKSTKALHKLCLR